MKKEKCGGGREEGSGARSLAFTIPDAGEDILVSTEVVKALFRGQTLQPSDIFVVFEGKI